MLSIAFIDQVPWDYVIDTPRVKPLGGSQSALCYLAEELAKRGHAVALYNKTKTPGEFRGVKCFNLSQSPVAEFSQYDAVIILNSGSFEIARQIRSAVGARTRILLWTQHNPDQPAVQDLADPASHNAWDGFVMVSRWQAQGYCDVFGIKPERIQIIGNAIAPVFENLFETPEAIAAQKPWPPVLCYTSTPFRGLDVLVEAFPRIRKAVPGATLKVYSSMGVYGVPGSQDPHAPLYARCRNTEGVDYIGSVSQTVLAGELKHVTCLAYPNTFAEGYCIAVHEAMAAGCLVITSDLGALRETTAGFAHLLAPPSDNALHAERFADFSVGVLAQVRMSPAEHAERLKDQVRFVHQTETWAVRAREWEAWLSSLMTVRADARAAAAPELFNAAMQHYRAGRLPEAEALYRQVLQDRPDHPDALHHLGMIAYAVGRYEEALDFISRAIRVQPARADYFHNLGETYRRMRKFDEAIVAFQRALELNPGLVEAVSNLGVAFYDQGKLEEALAYFHRALALAPDSAEIEYRILHLMQHLCEWNQLAKFSERTKRLLSEKPSVPIYPFVFLCMPSTPAEQLQCARNYAAHYLAPMAMLRETLGFRFTPAPRPRLRIGYLSGDIRRHAVGSMIPELFELHDRQAVEVCAYSYGPDDGSEIRKRVAAASDRFVDVRALSHVEAARRIHNDGIDILIDLQGHTQQARTQIVALRPAPIQVNWLGYPGTMGAEFMDYIVTDRFITPPGHEPFFSEKIVRLPDCYQVNDRRRKIAEPAPTRKDCGLPETGFVFCCFNNSYKITPAVFDVWARLLRQVPGSVLWLLETNSGVAANLRREAKARGAEPERLIFAPILPAEQHLARYRIADLFLDTWPYNAHTTTSDALWAGLPVLTCVGEAFASRVAGSLLTAIGLPELITHSLEEYEAAALRLARNPSGLAGLQERLAKNRLTAPLFDSARFTRNLEQAYRMMWEQYLKGDAPEPIEVPPLLGF